MFACQQKLKLGAVRDVRMSQLTYHPSIAVSVVSFPSLLVVNLLSLSVISLLSLYVITPLHLFVIILLHLFVISLLYLSVISLLHLFVISLLCLSVISLLSLHNDCGKTGSSCVTLLQKRWKEKEEKKLAVEDKITSVYNKWGWMERCSTHANEIESQRCKTGCYLIGMGTASELTNHSRLEFCSVPHLCLLETDSNLN